MPVANTKASEESRKIKGTADPMIATGILILQSWAIVATIINSKLDSEISSEILTRTTKVESASEKTKS